MSDSKSKLPDLNELGTMVGKLFKDIKSSVCGIMDDYKQKRPGKPAEAPKPTVKKPVTKTAVKEKKE